jgi:hypothetical protein
MTDDPGAVLALLVLVALVAVNLYATGDDR